MSPVTAADDVARFKHSGTRLPLSLPRNTAHAVSHEVWPGDPLPPVSVQSHTLPCGPAGARGVVVCVQTCGSRWAVCYLPGTSQQRPTDPASHTRIACSHALGMVLSAGPRPLQRLGVCPPCPRSLLVPGWWQHRASLPMASPGVSSVLGCPFHKDAGQWMRAALRE